MKPKTTSQINEIFRRHHIPFIADCNEKGEVKFYRIKEGSCVGEQITTRATEESVAKWLEKNTEKTFEYYTNRKPEKTVKKPRKKAPCPLCKDKGCEECPPCEEVKCPEPKPCPEPEKITKVDVMNITTDKDFEIGFSKKRRSSCKGQNALFDKKPRNRTVKKKGGFWNWLKNDLNKFFNR